MKYSHMNGEEYLIVHHPREYQEILDVIVAIDANKHLTKESGEKTKKGELVYSPGDINKDFKARLEHLNWMGQRRDFYVSTDPNIVRVLEPLEKPAQKDFLESQNQPLYDSYNQTDFVKNKIAIEVQLGKYFSVTYDFFVKHLSFYNAGYINIGIEIVPTKKMQARMSSGPPWFEKEVHNILRHGRNNPSVPLLVLGIEPDYFPDKIKKPKGEKHEEE